MSLELKFTQIRHNIEDLSVAIEEGEQDPLAVFLELKKLQKALEHEISEVLPYALEQAHQYGKLFDYKGCEINIRNTPGRWDFKNISDIIQAESELKSLKEKYKLIYQQSSNGLSTLDPDTGEILECPKYMPGKETLSIKFK